MTGSAKDEYFDLKGGDDTVYAGAGDDIVVAGGGNDTVYGGSGDDQMKGDAGDDSSTAATATTPRSLPGASTNYSVAYDGANASYTITDNAGPANEGIDTLKNVEFAKFSDGLFIARRRRPDPGHGPGPAPTNTPGSGARQRHRRGRARR